METVSNPSVEVDNVPKVSPKSPKVRPWVFIFVFLVMLSGFMFFALNFYLKSIGVDLKEVILKNIQTQEVSEVVETEENVEVIKEVEEDVITLENEGWSLYSIPEYGFSVEVPGTYHSTENSTDTRWEVSRKSLGREYFSDSEEISHIEEISINYFNEGLVYETRACGLGCNGEIYINIYIDKLNDVQTLDTVKSNIQEDFESRQDYLDGYSNEFTDISGDENMFNRSVWCAQLPNMEGLGFKNCYFDTSDYRVQVKFMGFNKEELEDSQSLDMYNIVETIKFE